jgi:hypothetical protein
MTDLLDKGDKYDPRKSSRTAYKDDMRYMLHIVQGGLPGPVPERGYKVSPRPLNQVLDSPR